MLSKCVPMRIDDDVQCIFVHTLMQSVGELFLVVDGLCIPPFIVVPPRK